MEERNMFFTIEHVGLITDQVKLASDGSVIKANRPIKGVMDSVINQQTLIKTMIWLLIR